MNHNTDTYNQQDEMQNAPKDPANLVDDPQHFNPLSSLKDTRKRNKNSDENDDIEQRISDLILMTGGKGPKRWKQRKKEYLKKLENDNTELRNIIVDLQQKINAYQSQKNIVLDQLRYFQGCLDQAAPFILQQSEYKKQSE